MNAQEWRFCEASAVCASSGFDEIIGRSPCGLLLLPNMLVRTGRMEILRVPLSIPMLPSAMTGPATSPSLDLLLANEVMAYRGGATDGYDDMLFEGAHCKRCTGARGCRGGMDGGSSLHHRSPNILYHITIITPLCLYVRTSLSILLV